MINSVEVFIARPPLLCSAGTSASVMPSDGHGMTPAWRGCVLRAPRRPLILRSYFYKRCWEAKKTDSSNPDDRSKRRFRLERSCRYSAAPRQNDAGGIEQVGRG